MAKWRANTWHRRMVAVLGILFLPVVATTAAAEVTRQVYSVPAGSHPHDVAPDPAPGGPVWYTAQHQGALGRLDPQTGKPLTIPLDRKSVVTGERVSDGVDLGGRRLIKQKKKKR